MEITKFYEKVLKLEEPWYVESVDSDDGKQEILVKIKHREKSKFLCPDCGVACSVYDHQRARKWRDKDTVGFKTILTADVPRIECKEHGTRVVKLPWSESHSRFTTLFERHAINILKECPLQQSSRILDLSWDEIDGIMSRAVLRGLRRKEIATPKQIGVDEKSYLKNHKYLTIVVNHDNKAVEFVTTGRKEESLNLYFKGLNDKQKETIESVSMDMWEAYINSVTANLPDAKIVFDAIRGLMQPKEVVKKNKIGFGRNEDN